MRQAATDTGQAVALMFIGDPEARPADRTAALRLAYGLTPVEAHLAQALAEGHVLKEFAAERNTSYQTVRAQLKQVMAKTGARRQADLVRLLRAIV